MSTYLAHGATTAEIAKYKRIDGNTHFSLAEYDSESISDLMHHFIHAHEEYEFVIPLKTVPLLYYEKANYIGEVGFIYPVNPNVEHGLEFDMSSSQAIDITVERSYMESMKRRLGFPNEFFYSRFPCKRSLLEIVSLYQDECARRDRDEAKVHRLIDAILSSLIEDGLTEQKDTRRPEKRYGKNIRTTLIYMNEHYKDPELTIAFLAKQNGYSLTYFSKAFKAYMHDTPIGHLNRLRTSAARSLLKDKSLTLEKIAHMVGYRNLSTFTEAFKHLLHMTPSQYRRIYS